MLRFSVVVFVGLRYPINNNITVTTNVSTINPATDSCTMEALYHKYVHLSTRTHTHTLTCTYTYTSYRTMQPQPTTCQSHHGYSREIFSNRWGHIPALLGGPLKDYHLSNHQPVIWVNLNFHSLTWKLRTFNDWGDFHSLYPLAN